MKRILQVLILVLLAASLALSLAACSNEQSLTGECKIVIASTPETVYTVDLSEVEITEGVYSVLKYLRDTEGLEFTAQESAATGAYLTELEGLELSAGQYIYTWTSVESDFDASGMAEDVEYNGITLKPSATGLSSMSLEDGAIIYIGYIEF